MTKTRMAKSEDTVHEWYLVDAADKVLGRAATKIASLLDGKSRPDYTPNVDNGAGVIVMNCDKIRVTGKKKEGKLYKRFSGYPGGLKEIPYGKMMEKEPKYILWHAVKGMLPKNKLGARMILRLKLYLASEKHPHTAQKPKAIEI